MLNVHSLRTGRESCKRVQKFLNFPLRFWKFISKIQFLTQFPKIVPIKISHYMIYTYIDMCIQFMHANQLLCALYLSALYITLNAFYYIDITDNIDSSGMRFTLTRMPRQYNAGVSGLGAEVNSNLFVPPNTDPFNIYGYCPSACTSRVRKYISSINNFGIIGSCKLANWDTVGCVLFEDCNFRGFCEFSVLHENCFTKI